MKAERSWSHDKVVLYTTSAAGDFDKVSFEYEILKRYLIKILKSGVSLLCGCIDLPWHFAQSVDITFEINLFVLVLCITFVVKKIFKDTCIIVSKNCSKIQ